MAKKNILWGVKKHWNQFQSTKKNLSIFFIRTATQGLMSVSFYKLENMQKWDLRVEKNLKQSSPSIADIQWEWEIKLLQDGSTSYRGHANSVSSQTKV